MNFLWRQAVYRDVARHSAQPRWIQLAIDVGAGFFIFALVASAVFDSRIRVLHALQALIYLAVMVGSRRGSAWAFGAGCFVAAFWNYTNLFVTTFVRAGIHQLGLLVTTGRVPRPDLLIAVFAAGGHFLLILGCLAGLLRTRPAGRDWIRFTVGGVLAIAYLVAIIATTGRQYVPLLRLVFHL